MVWSVLIINLFYGRKNSLNTQASPQSVSRFGAFGFFFDDLAFKLHPDSDWDVNIWSAGERCYLQLFNELVKFLWQSRQTNCPIPFRLWNGFQHHHLLCQFQFRFHWLSSLHLQPHRAHGHHWSRISFESQKHCVFCIGNLESELGHPVWDILNH